MYITCIIEEYLLVRSQTPGNIMARSCDTSMSIIVQLYIMHNSWTELKKKKKKIYEIMLSSYSDIHVLPVL